MTATAPAPAAPAAGDWRAAARETLLALAAAVRDLAGRLLSDAAGRGPDEFAADLRKVHAAAGRLVGPLEAWLDPAAPPARRCWTSSPGT